MGKGGLTWKTRLARHARRMLCPLLLGWFGSPAAGAVPTHYNFVVAPDGSGDFTSVQAAIDAVPAQSPETTAIYVKAGTYTEKLSLDDTKWNVELIGENADNTILTWNDYGGEADTAFYTDGVTSTASTYVAGKNFTARNLTFANSAGAGAQAIALAATGRRGRFFDCRFLGYQDTLLAMYGKQFFKRCYVEGVTDFIYGNATAVFAHCTISCQDAGFVTAAATPATHDFGFVFRYCTVTGGAPDGSVFLGRPWGDTARVVFFRCELGPQIIPAGWAGSDGAGGDGGSVLFAEYDNTGAGARAAGRVDWSTQLTDDEAAAYTLKRIFGIGTSGGRMDVDVTSLPWYNEGL